MKRNIKSMKLVSAICLSAIIATCSIATGNAAAPKKGVTLQSGTILYSAVSCLAGTPIPLGFDQYGYNYQAHMFSGSYFNSYANGWGFPPYEGDDDAYLAANPTVEDRRADGSYVYWAWPYRNDQLAMKWNDAWLSNQDRNGDGKLDSHYGFPTYVGSGAWENNHQSGDYTDATGDQSWNYFVKIVAVPADATKVAGVWYDASGTEIGPDIWGEFAEVQNVYNDTGTGEHGCYYHSPAGPGVGKY